MSNPEVFAEPSGKALSIAPAGSLTPLMVLERAVNSGANIETLERLMALSERWQANQAQRAFTQALAELRDDLPSIVKTRTVDFSSKAGRTHYKYEDLGEVTEQLSPALAKHGLSFRWRTDSTAPGYVGVTCVLAHKDGHSEETTLTGPYDLSGNKNPIQAIGSVVTYLQRYTLKAAIGIAAAQDDDGRQEPPGVPPPSYQQEKPPVQAAVAEAASEKQIAFASKLSKSSHITDQERAGLDRRIARGMDKETASEAIEWLQAQIAARKAAQVGPGAGALPFDDVDQDAGTAEDPADQSREAAASTPPGTVATIGPEGAAGLLRTAKSFLVAEEQLVGWVSNKYAVALEELDSRQEAQTRAWIKAQVRHK